MLEEQKFKVRASANNIFINYIVITSLMRLENIKALGIRHLRHVEIRYPAENGDLETKCGWFVRLFELPEGMTEIPAEYKSSYPVDPPFIEIAYRLDRNHCPKDIVQYKPEQIHWLRILKPDVEF